ncbi:dihydroxyacetone kinase family protein [Streptococcus dysgalactiae subsp. equisimilis]|nr:dihydroxyacetone kinase family protein [Streptococcus dysgalactiae subsp. equisimilis]
MLSAAIYGDIFTPPTATDILEALRFLDKGKGVFVIIKNFEADIREFSQAIHLARQEGRNIKYIISHDDISVEPKKQFQMRHRGLAGTILLHKILGAAAQSGASLDDLEHLAFDLATEIATIGFATKSASLPNAALPLFDLPNHQIHMELVFMAKKAIARSRLCHQSILLWKLLISFKLNFIGKKTNILFF